MAAHLQRDPVPRVVSVDTLFSDPGIGQIPAPGETLHPAGDRFIFAVHPNTGDTGDPDATASGPGRLILVQNFQEKLGRRPPGN